MASVISIGDPVNDDERKAIAWLRDHLPDDYYVIHNFEVDQYGQPFEVDLCVIAPHAIYVCDVKGVHGKVDVVGNEWHPVGRRPYKSPLPKLRGNAKSLSGLIAKQNSKNKDLKNIFVDVAVLLSVDDVEFNDSDNRERGQVIKLADSRRYFTDANRIPDRFTSNVLRYIKVIAEALGSVARKPDDVLRFGDWQVDETLQAKDEFTDYRAFNVHAGKRGGTVMLRAYKADAYLADEQARENQQRLLENAFLTLNRLPPHQSLVGVRNFFLDEIHHNYILVMDDIPGETLASALKD